MMNEFEQAKKEYEQIPVPEELADRVQAGIRQGRAKRMQRKWKRGAGAVGRLFGAGSGNAEHQPHCGGPLRRTCRCWEDCSRS